MITRVRYFAGQLLGAADFETEQSYVIERFRRLNRWLHGWGIVGGLQVSVGSGEIVVAPGLAMDCVGNEIEIDQATRLPLSGPGRVCYLTLAFTEREVGPQPALSDPPGSDEEPLAYSCVEEGGELALAPADPALAHARNGRRSDPCGRPHPIAIARLVRLGSRWRLDPFFRPGRARSWRAALT
jgi:hypothetical protein